MHIFENTETAFRIKSNKELRKTAILFRLMSKPLMVRVSSWLAVVAPRLRIPVRWLVKPTIFSLFCGGETIEESIRVIEKLAENSVDTVLDYAAENQESEEQIQAVMEEIRRTMDLAAENRNVPFTVFKPTALAPARVLSEAGNSNRVSREAEKFAGNIRTLCRAAWERGIPVMIDAEECHYQHIIDKLAMEMMEKYNKEKAIVYNTLQMYRHDRLGFLKNCINESTGKKYYLGIKLVRGAYMDQERERAAKHGYPSPVYPDKQSTDNAFNSAMRICLDNIGTTRLFAGTHNEKSMLLLMELMKERNMDNSDPRVCVSQLYGMSDHISFNMASLSYNVAKYLPYGPVRFLMPYLLRRAEENKSVTGQAGRELQWVNIEIERRKKK